MFFCRTKSPISNDRQQNKHYFWEAEPTILHCVNVPSNGGQFLALFIPNLNKLKRSLKMLVVMMSSAIKPLRHAFVIIGTTLSNMLCVQFGGNDNIDEKHDNISKSERLSMP